MPKFSIGVKPKKGKFNGHPFDKLDKPVRFQPEDPRFESGDKSCDPFYPNKHCSGNQYYTNNYGYNEFGPYPRYGMRYYHASSSIAERRARYMRYQRQQVANKAHPLLDPYGRHRGLHGDGTWPSL